MYPTSHYKTKIIGGKLVTVPIYNNDNSPYSSHGDYQSHTRYPVSTDIRNNTLENSHYRYDAASNIQINIKSSARLEAQKNKQRAVAQTYRSVLSPEPTRRAVSTTQYADPLSNQVANCVSSSTRHKLLSVLSFMRRLDPYEHGVLSRVEVHEVLAAHAIHMDSHISELLMNKFHVSSGEIAYTNMWKYVMDCFANKEKLTIPNLEKKEIGFKQHLEEYYRNMLLNADHQENYSKSLVKPGLRAELEFELRHYARTNQVCLNTRSVEYAFRTLDRYDNGKLLYKQMLDICYKELVGVDMNVISNAMKACDTDQSGLVDYNMFLKLVSNAQPTYLPPINASPRALITGEISTDPKYLWHPSQSYENPSHQINYHDYAIYNGTSGGISTKAIPASSGHAKDLEKLGGLDLRLSDFETKIHSKKSPVPTPPPPQESSANHYTTPTKDTSRTYSIESNESSPRLLGNKHDNNLCISSPKQSPRRSAIKTPLHQTSPKRTPSRRQWNNMKTSSEDRLTMCKTPNTTSRTVTKLEKWWKKELDSSGNSGYGSKLGRKTWGQSKPVKSVKSRRRRKKKFLKTHANPERRTNKDVGDHSTITDSECFTPTDIDSEMYTTTDIEVVENVTVKNKISPYKIIPAISPTSEGKSLTEFASAPPEEKDSVLSENCNLQDKNGEEVKSSEIVNEEQSSKTDKITTPPCSDESVANMNEKLKLISLSPEHGNPDSGGLVKLRGKQYKVYPSFEEFNQLQNNTSVEHKLQLEWVYGCGNKLHVVSSTEVLFYIGRVVVLFDTEKQKQRYYRKHTGGVTSLCLHPDKVTIATAQENTEKKCIIYLWNLVDLSTTSSIFIQSEDVLEIVAMDFCKTKACGETLATVQRKHSGHSVYVYDSEKWDVKYRLEEDHLFLKNVKINDLLYSDVDAQSFITFGKNGHLVFFKIDHNTLNGTAADFGALSNPKNITSAIFNRNGDLITGDANGSLYVWQKNTHRIHHAIHGAHSGPITAMCYTKQGYLLTGCSRETVVIAWDEQMKCLDKKLELCDSQIGCKSISVDSGVLYISTSVNSLLRARIMSEDAVFSAKEMTTLSESNADVITGICCHPSYDEMMLFVSSDGCVTMLNIETKTTVWTCHVKGNGSCVCFHPCKEYICVGCQDGSIHLINATTGNFIDKFKESQAAVSCLNFSPDGLYLACGMANGMIVCFLFDNQNQDLEARNILKNGCNSSIIAVDWCTKSDIIRAQSKSEGIFYCIMLTGELINTKKTISWATNTCITSYEMLGFWMNVKNPHESIVFNVCKKNRATAFAHENQLCVAEYPWIEKKTTFYSTPSCGYGTLTTMAFTLNGSYLLSSFNHDGCLWQWKIV